MAWRNSDSGNRSGSRQTPSSAVFGADIAVLPLRWRGHPSATRVDQRQTTIGPLPPGYHPDMLRCTVDGDYPIAVGRVAGRGGAAGIPEVRTAIRDGLGTEPEAVIVDFSAAVVGTDDCWTEVAALARQAMAWPGSAMALAGAA